MPLSSYLKSKRAFNPFMGIIDLGPLDPDKYPTDPEIFENEAKEKEKAGFTVLVASDKELFLDLDGGIQSKALFAQRLNDLQRDGMGRPRRVKMWQSKTPGHLHAVIELLVPIKDVGLRIALQMYLGSDPKAGFAQIDRLNKGIAKIRLFRPPNAQVFEFDVNDFK